jgi:hypothetical protein
VDAAHFVFAPFLGFLWCATRRFVRAASGRKRYSLASPVFPIIPEEDLSGTPW